jgi:hypothetical protein
VSPTRLTTIFKWDLLIYDGGGRWMGINLFDLFAYWANNGNFTAHWSLWTKESSTIGEKIMDLN